MNRQRTKLIESYTDVISNGIFYGLIMGTNQPPWTRSVNYNTLNTVYFYNWGGEKYISPYLKNLFKYYDVDKCDMQISGQTPPYTLSNNVINQHLKDIYFKKWTELWGTLNYTYNPISNYDMTETESIEHHDTTHNDRGEQGTNSGTEGTSHTGTITNDSSGSIETHFTPEGVETTKEKFDGTETDTLTKSGTENTTTDFFGEEDNTRTGTKTISRTLQPTGTETETRSNTTTITNLTNDSTLYAFNTTTPPTAQNSNTQNGSTADNGSVVKSFTQREDRETTTENYTNLKDHKEYTNRTDDTTTTYNNRTDTNQKTFNQRENITTKSFTDREDITSESHGDRNTETFADTVTLTRNLANSSIITDSGRQDGTTTRTLTRSGNIGVTTAQQMIESQRDLLLWDYFYKIVFPDIDKILTLSIY